MKRNLDRLGGLVFSQRVLLALTQKGASREEAYELTQRNAMAAWREQGDFLTKLKADKDVLHYLTPNELAAQFDFSFYTRHVDDIFERVFRYYVQDGSKAPAAQ
jgi:adenylosuccinate lyase